MRIACIYWKTSSVGGIATHLNSLRAAAIANGDTFDILHSSNWKKKEPRIFLNREWIRGGDTKIWVDGEVPSGEETARASLKWLEKNYDAIVFGFICPHETKAYPNPEFLPLYDSKLPKVAFVMDGYWEEYAHWAVPLLNKLVAVLCPIESYAIPIRSLGYSRLIISAFPFQPRMGRLEPKSQSPLLIWPNQWKNIKGVTQFLEVVPEIPEAVDIELYSNGIRYYQLRTDPIWKAAVKTDRFQSFHGEGRATFFGNVDIPDIAKAYQRAWYTVNLQGMKSKKDTYKKGSYNNTEVEALYYGACPILHVSTGGTDMPRDVYLSVKNAGEISEVIRKTLKSGFALDPDRRKKAREFVLDKHLASRRYQDLRRLFD